MRRMKLKKLDAQRAVPARLSSLLRMYIHSTVSPGRALLCLSCSLFALLHPLFLAACPLLGHTLHTYYRYSILSSLVGERG